MVWESLSLALRLFWHRLGILTTANIVWLGLSLPVVTWPLATAGLYYLVQRVVEEELDAAPRYARLSDLWIGIRLHGMRSMGLTVIGVGCLIAITTALTFYGGSSNEALRWVLGPVVLMGLAWMGSQLYAYPLLIQRAERSPWRIAREAFLMAVSYPSFTLSMLLSSLALAFASFVLAGPVLLVFFSMMAMIQTISVRSILVLRGEVVPVDITGEGGVGARHGR